MGNAGLLSSTVRNPQARPPRAWKNCSLSAVSSCTRSCESGGPEGSDKKGPQKSSYRGSKWLLGEGFGEDKGFRVYCLGL